MRLDAKIPAGPLPQKWDLHRFETKLVNPANKRKYDIIVVGTGLKKWWWAIAAVVAIAVVVRRLTSP